MKFFFQILLMFLFTVSIVSQAEIFKWVDKNGQIHYDDKPPLKDKNSKTTMDINEESNSVRGLSDSRLEKRKKLLGAIEEDRKQRKEDEFKAKKKKKKLTRQCHNARDSLKSYQRSSYVYDLDKDGNRVALPSSARDNIISRLKKGIEENCK